MLQSQADCISSASSIFGPPGLKPKGQGAVGLRIPERESAFIVKNTFLEVPEEEQNDSSEEDNSFSPIPFRRRRGSSFYRSASEPRFPHRIEVSVLDVEASLTSHSDNVEAQDDATSKGTSLIGHGNFQCWSVMTAVVDDEPHEVEYKFPVQPSVRATPAVVYDTDRCCAHMLKQQGPHHNQPVNMFPLMNVHQVAGMPQSENSAVGWPTCMDPHFTWATQSPTMAGTYAVNDASAVAAAMYAGFNAGLMAAWSANLGIPQPVPSSDAKNAPPRMQRSRHDSVRNCEDSKPVQHRSQDRTARKPQRHGATIGDVERYHVRTRKSSVDSQGQQFDFDSKLRGTTPRQSFSSCASDTSTTVSYGASSLHELRAPSPLPEPNRATCHLIWCDQRAFKEVSNSWKRQLEAATRIQVKTHKTSEKCIRLLRKKQRSQARPPCVFLVSWANAPTLLPFLGESPNTTYQVILLCDTDMCRGRNRDAAERLASCYPFAAHLAASWDDAVVVASRLVRELQGLY